MTVVPLEVSSLLFVPALLVVMLAMEWVERPLRHAAVGEQLADFLVTARPDEVEAYVSESLEDVLAHYWRKRT